MFGKFTWGVIVGAAGYFLYDAYKKGNISCCIERGEGECGCGCECNESEHRGGGEDFVEKGKKAAHDVVDAAAEKAEQARHGFEKHVAEPVGKLAE